MSGFMRSLVNYRPKAVVQQSNWGMTGGVGFRAAEHNRLLRDWIWRYVSADQEIWWDLLELRGRSRELVRNSAWGANYVRVIRNNVMGPLGIRLQPDIRKADGTPNDAINLGIREAWEDWGCPDYCSVDGKSSWLELQNLMAENLAMDGELVIRMIRGFDNPYGFALQVIDPDQLDHMYILSPGQDSNEIRSGIEVDKWGRPVAYHIWKGHPADPHTPRIRERIPAKDIIHLFHPYRVAQTRGIPWLASVMLNLNHLRGYMEAEQVAARVAAAKGGFFVRKSEDGGPGMSTDTDQEHLSMDAEPGLFEELPSGMEFQGFDPQHPTTAFHEFVRAQLRAIAAGGGVSATSLSKDLADVNYSSIRAGLLDERDEAKRIQKLFIDHLHTRVVKEWWKMSRLLGAVDGRIGSDISKLVRWRPRGWAWVDPKNDVEAAVLAIQNGMDSRTRQMSEDGLEFEEILDELASEQKIAKEKGVQITGAAQITARPPTEREGLTPDQQSTETFQQPGQPPARRPAGRIPFEMLS